MHPEPSVVVSHTDSITSFKMTPCMRMHVCKCPRACIMLPATPRHGAEHDMQGLRQGLRSLGFRGFSGLSGIRDFQGCRCFKNSGMQFFGCGASAPGL